MEIEEKILMILVIVVEKVVIMPEIVQKNLLEDLVNVVEIVITVDRGVILLVIVWNLFVVREIQWCQTQTNISRVLEVVLPPIEEVVIRVDQVLEDHLAEPVQVEAHLPVEVVGHPIETVVHLVEKVVHHVGIAVRLVETAVRPVETTVHFDKTVDHHEACLVVVPQGKLVNLPLKPWNLFPEVNLLQIEINHQEQIVKALFTTFLLPEIRTNYKKTILPEEVRLLGWALLREILENLPPIGVVLLVGVLLLNKLVEVWTVYNEYAKLSFFSFFLYYLLWDFPKGRIRDHLNLVLIKFEKFLQILVSLGF